MDSEGFDFLLNDPNIKFGPMQKQTGVFLPGGPHGLDYDYRFQFGVTGCAGTIGPTGCAGTIGPPAPTGPKGCTDGPVGGCEIDNQKESDKQKESEKQKESIKFNDTITIELTDDYDNQILSKIKQTISEYRKDGQIIYLSPSVSSFRGKLRSQFQEEYNQMNEHNNSIKQAYDQKMGPYLKEIEQLRQKLAEIGGQIEYHLPGPSGYKHTPDFFYHKIKKLTIFFVKDELFHNFLLDNDLI